MIRNIVFAITVNLVFSNVQVIHNFEAFLYSVEHRNVFAGKLQIKVLNNFYGTISNEFDFALKKDSGLNEEN